MSSKDTMPQRDTMIVNTLERIKQLPKETVLPMDQVEIPLFDSDLLVTAFELFPITTLITTSTRPHVTDGTSMTQYVFATDTPDVYFQFEKNLEKANSPTFTLLIRKGPQINAQFRQEHNLQQTE